jgi:hypothetical protein
LLLCRKGFCGVGAGPAGATMLGRAYLGFMMPWPTNFAAYRLPDGRWQLVAPDDDPRRPPWRRLMIVSATGYPGDKKPPTDWRPLNIVRLRRR